jgi:hypothetical protein
VVVEAPEHSACVGSSWKHPRTCPRQGAQRAPPCLSLRYRVEGSPKLGAHEPLGTEGGDFPGTHSSLKSFLPKTSPRLPKGFLPAKTSILKSLREAGNTRPVLLLGRQEDHSPVKGGLPGVTQRTGTDAQGFTASRPKKQSQLLVCK